MANNNSVIPHEYDDVDLSTRFNKWVKGLNPSLTTSFSVGGWSMNDGPSKYTGGIDYSNFFSQMASTSGGRQTFIKSCIQWARDLGFDGIDIVSKILRLRSIHETDAVKGLGLCR
jgi:chitinase